MFSSVQFSSINGKTQHTPVQQAWPIAGPTSSMGVSYIRWATRTGPLGRCAAPLLPREAPLALMPPASPLRSVDARKSARPRGPCRRIPASRDAHDRTCAGLHTISDANWETARSCTGFVVMLNMCAVAWAAKKQPATALSSTEAETYAAAAAAAETVWARGLMAELGYGQPQPTTLWVDNTGAAAIANDAGSVGRSRHIARRANFLLDMHERGEIETRHMPGEDTVADTLTKPLEKKKFIRLREYLLNMRGRASELCATGATVRKKVADGYRRIADAGAPRGSA